MSVVVNLLRRCNVTIERWRNITSTEKENCSFLQRRDLLILRAYREHPTRWADVLADVKENIDRLPDARDLYTNSSQRKLTYRMSAKLGKLIATRGQIEDEDIRREVDLIRDNKRRHVRNVPAAPAVQPDDLSDHEQNNQADEQDNDQPAAADRRTDVAASITDTESDGEPAEPQPRRRRRRLADLMRENHELYNDFMKRKMPRLMRHFGLDSSSDY